MGLLSPWFLAGLAAVALPLWLHLLQQYKKTPQRFSSLMFFERRLQSTVLNRRLRYLLLLSLRLLLLILLVLAFANPFVNRKSAAANRRTLTLIAVDRSFSMRYGDRMLRAKQAAHRAIDTLGARDLAQVAALDSHLEDLTSPELNRGALKAAVDVIEPEDRPSSFGEFARALRFLDQTSGMQLRVHFISDMQQTSMPAGFRDLQVGPHTSLELHKIGQQNRPNWAVESVNVASRVTASANSRLTATLAGWDTPAAARQVSLVLDNKVLATKNVDLAVNGHAQVEFSGFEVPYGVHRGEIRLEPHDNLPQDDSYPFSIQRSDPRKVLFLYADYSSQRNGRSDLLRNPGFYYKAALEAGPDTGLTVQTSSLDNAPDMDFSKFAFVVLNDPGELDQKLADQLCAYLMKGGAALITLGPNTARLGRIPLSKESFTEQREKQAVGYVDVGNPAMISGARFENVQFLETAWISPKPEARVIAKFADGSPLLLEERAGEGRKLIFASTLDDSTNDFALHASFVPFTVQTAHYLAGWEDNPSSIVSGTPITLRRTRDQSTAADVIGPDGKHELSLDDATKALSFEPAHSGFYEVVRADGAHLLTAVHADRRESDLRSVSDETLDLWRNTGGSPANSREPGGETQTRPWSLWRYVLAAGLVAALVESLFSSRYLMKNDRKEGQTA